jgi:hypothetical protein
MGADAETSGGPAIGAELLSTDDRPHSFAYASELTRDPTVSTIESRS